MAARILNAPLNWFKLYSSLDSDKHLLLNLFYEKGFRLLTVYHFCKKKLRFENCPQCAGNKVAPLYTFSRVLNTSLKLRLGEEGAIHRCSPK